MFLLKIALNNLRANRKLIIPYIISGGIFVAFSLMMISFVNYSNLIKNSNDSTGKILSFGLIILIFIAFLFLIYANGYITKQRNRQFGLYAMLGMNKGQIKHINEFEDIITYIFIQLIGNILSLGFSKLFFLIFKKIVGINSKTTYSYSIYNIGLIAIIFLCLTGMILVWNNIKISRLNLKQLFHNVETKEDNGKIPWITGIISMVIMIMGYSIALISKSPMQVTYRFLFAASLVAIGIFLVFSSGSILVLNILKKNKHYYYRMPHFINLSIIMHRIKRNANALGLITLLCTMTFVMFSSIACIYISKEALINDEYPYDYMTQINNSNPIYLTGKNDKNRLYQIHHLSSIFDHQFRQRAKKWHVRITNSANIKVSSSINGDFINNHFKLNNTMKATRMLSAIDINDYNQMQKTNLKLKPNHIMIYNPENKYEQSYLKIGHNNYAIQKSLSKSDLKIRPQENNSVIPNALIIMNNQDMQQLYRSLKLPMKKISIMGYDVKLPSNQNMAKNFHMERGSIEINKKVSNINGNQGNMIQDKSSINKLFSSILGNVFFIGIMFSMIFAVLTAITIYYKQVSESMEDQHSYQTLNQIGMSHQEINNITKKQIIITTFIPIIFAIINTGFAFPILIRILSLFNITNVEFLIGVTMITVIIFGLLYMIIVSIINRINHNQTKKSYIHVLNR